MIVELSPVAYLALCGLVDDALMSHTDATPLLMRVSEELRSATAAGIMPSELLEEPARLESLRRAGFVAR